MTDALGEPAGEPGNQPGLDRAPELDQLPPDYEFIGRLNAAINRRAAQLASDLEPTERKRLATEIAALITEREAAFLEQAGVPASAAWGLAARIIGEGLHIAEHAIGANINNAGQIVAASNGNPEAPTAGEADLRQQNFDVAALLEQEAAEDG